mgnify:CR=1 FL=1
MSDASYWKSYRERNKEKIAAYHRQYRVLNRERVLASHRKWYAENKDKARASAKRYKDAHKDDRRMNRKATDSDRFSYIRRTYGVKKEDFIRLYEAFNGRCGMCKKNLTIRSACVDHSHVTNKVRGLLCRNCNVGLGLIGDTVESAKNAVEHLQRGE